MFTFPGKKNVYAFLCQNPGLYRLLIRYFPNAGRIQQGVYLKFVKKGDHVIDIGANEGNITLLLSHIVGQKGKVYAYEALEKTFQKLLSNINKTGVYQNVSAFNLAVSDVEKEVAITVPGDDFGQASMRSHEKGSWSAANKFTEFKVNSIILDGHITQFKKIDFIKIDIEGAELLALKGATEILKKFKPVLYLEIFKGWTKEFNYEPIDLYGYLRSLGYTKFCIVTNEGMINVTNPEVQLNREYSADLVCIYN